MSNHDNEWYNDGRYDWGAIAKYLSEKTATFQSIRAMAKYLGIPYGTVYDAYQRGDLPGYLVQEGDGLGVITEDELPDDANQVSWEESGNEATLKYQAGEPLTPEEVCEIAGVDFDEWEIADHEVTVWQMGRKAKEVDLKWFDGRADGYVKDSGEINKTYLYRTRVKLTRKKRIAVRPSFEPVEIYSTQFYPNFASERTSGLQSTLFIADPHFGFVRTPDGLLPIHHRRFLTALLGITRDMGVINNVVWNGDLLDLADWSTFDSEPELLFHTQLAGIEAAWMLGQFRLLTDRQVLIEGNHEVRMRKALVKNMEAAYGIKSVHDLDGPDLLSVPRFLGLEQLATEWLQGYPHARLELGGAIYSHGSTSRKGSGRTSAYLAKEAARSHFFGHTHRHELVRKWVPDIEKEIWVGSPGCACIKERTPGAGANNNWQLGAFLIHHDARQTLSVEHIRGSINGDTWFRGGRWSGGTYFHEFIETVPERWRRRFS